MYIDFGHVYFVVGIYHIFIDSARIYKLNKDIIMMNNYKKELSEWMQKIINHRSIFYV